MPTADRWDRLKALLTSDRTVEISALGPPRSPSADSAPSPEGRRIGAYRLVRLMGEGGMGAVYLAERADEAWLELHRADTLRASETGEPDRIAAKIREADAGIKSRENP